MASPSPASIFRFFHHRFHHPNTQTYSKTITFHFHLLPLYYISPTQLQSPFAINAYLHIVIFACKRGDALVKGESPTHLFKKKRESISDTDNVGDFDLHDEVTRRKPSVLCLGILQEQRRASMFWEKEG